MIMTSVNESLIDIVGIEHEPPGTGSGTARNRHSFTAHPSHAIAQALAQCAVDAQSSNVVAALPCAHAGARRRTSIEYQAPELDNPRHEISRAL